MQIGEEIIIFDWFRLHFIENSGMAYGIGSDWGEIAKFFLTFFRIVVVIFGVLYIRRVISEKQLPGRLLICLGIIIGGALGNVIDSVFAFWVPRSIHHRADSRADSRAIERARSPNLLNVVCLIVKTNEKTLPVVLLIV